MTDRELLESAARAAGMNATAKDGWHWCSGVGPKQLSGMWKAYWPDPTRDDKNPRPIPLRWNPLEDDGDALRLAIYAGLRVSVFREHPSRGNPRVEVEYRDAVIGGLVFRFVCLAHGGVGFEEAARRAITRAAAAIGEKVK